MIRWGSRCCRVWMILVFVIATTVAAWAELRTTDLALPRRITERDWLQLKLEVLGQQLSFPAYRVQLKLDSDQRIVFAFLASSGLADQLTEKIERDESERILEYHANGIRQQIEDLLKTDFPLLWERYDAGRDFHGVFLGPGAKWDDPPSAFGVWRQGRFQWQH